MRRELQVEPLILCLVQPAPSGTPAYKPRKMEDIPSHNKHRNNNNFKKQSIEKNNKNSVIEKDKLLPNTNKAEEPLSGRTRRRRSALAT